jgi:hypothetical protein
MSTIEELQQRKAAGRELRRRKFTALDLQERETWLAEFHVRVLTQIDQAEGRAATD